MSNQKPLQKPKRSNIVTLSDYKTDTSDLTQLMLNKLDDAIEVINTKTNENELLQQKNDAIMIVAKEIAHENKELKIENTELRTILDKNEITREEYRTRSEIIENSKKQLNSKPIKVERGADFDKLVEEMKSLIFI